MGLLSRVSEIKKKAQGAASRLNEANRRFVEAKQRKTKEKYQRQIEREAAKLKTIKEEQRVIQARLQTANIKRQLN